MVKSANHKVQDFINQVIMVDHEKFQIIEAVRKKVFAFFPGAKERMMYGGIFFSFEDDFGGVFAYKNHVSFELSAGYLLKDPDKLLEGKGKFRRHLKIRSMGDKQLEALDYFLGQISS